ncbi:MAG: hypothetical protein ACOZHQ_09315 [Thermodesulfobacteriota bacterium]
MSGEVATREEVNAQAPVAYQGTMPALAIEQVVGQVSLVQKVMRSVMKDGEHFGVIPGTGNKPSLLKSGAEKLAHTFMLAPRYTIQRHELVRDHREYEVVCEIISVATGHFLGSGVGTASTMETKYRFRRAEIVCPKCGKAAIIKGKKEYGGGWVCFNKKGGCGAKFKDGDQAITSQQTGRIEHDNPADFYNTVKKMAKKRAFVDAVLTVTAASDIFTQDVDDLGEEPPIEAEYYEASQGAPAGAGQGPATPPAGAGAPPQSQEKPPAGGQVPPPSGPPAPDFSKPPKTVKEAQERIWAALLYEQDGDKERASVRLAELTQGVTRAEDLTQDLARQVWQALKKQKEQSA